MRYHPVSLTPDNLILFTGEMPTAGASEESKAQQTQTSRPQGADTKETGIQRNAHSRRPTVVLNELTEANTLERARKLGK